MRHLRYFIAVAEELSFRKASERVHIDQTPLSRTVRDLEDRLGVKLIVRAPRGIRLTPAGTKLLDHSRRLFVRLEHLVRAVRETDARYREPLRVGVTDGMAQPRLADCLSGWQSIAPDVLLEFKEFSPGALVVALRAEEIDVGFTFGVPAEKGILEEPAWAYPIVAVVSPRHELASRPAVSLAELFAFPMVACAAEAQPGLRRQMDAVLSQSGLKPVIAAEADTLPGYIMRVAAGLGVGVADAGHMGTLSRTDIVVIPLLDPLKLTTFVVHKRSAERMHRALQYFLAHVRSPH